jgi:hypothetical protein
MAHPDAPARETGYVGCPANTPGGKGAAEGGWWARRQDGKTRGVVWDDDDEGEGGAGTPRS